MTAPIRTSPPYAGPELETLVGFLDWQRETFRMKCADLAPEQLLQRASPPSTMCLLGLLRHLADVEYGWFREHFAGEDEQLLYDTEDGDFNVTEADAGSVAQTWALFDTQLKRARAIVAAATTTDLSVRTTKRGDHTSLRWVMLHMIVEYARHNGHADLLREAIDGTVGE
jgi:uncharacterized damage-inducible protein DinB